MAREVTARDLEDLGDERFEQLVASLVFAEEPEAERPDAPDGGADVLRPATTERRARVWQAKFFRSKPNWTKYKKSLDDAVDSYDPEEVTFVFPRNLTKPRRDKFQEKLVGHHARVKVNFWGLQKIQELLAAHPDIAKRYFGEDRDDVLPGLIRAVKQGGKELENTRDLADRAFELDAFADVYDPGYEYETSFGPADAAPRVWADTPFMVVERIRDGRRVTVEARLRPEAEAQAYAGFTDDEAGDRAREKAREALAAGTSVELTEGTWLRVENAPVVAAEAMEAAKEDGYESRARLSPGEPRELQLILGEGDEAPRRTFTAYPLPPPKGLQLSYGSIGEGLTLFADFELPKPPLVSLNLRLTWRGGDNPREKADAAQFLLEFIRADRVVCIADGLLPEGGLIVEGEHKPQASDEDVNHLEFSATLWDAVDVVEAKFGPLKVPDSIQRDEFEQLVAAASFLRRSGGTLSFTELVIELPFEEADAFLARAEAGHPGRLPIKFSVFGRELDLGFAEFKTPPVKFIAPERGSTPNTARIRLRTENKDIPFRLVPPEADTKERTISPLLWTPDQGPSGLLSVVP
jgi:hypothetical protein